MISRTIRYYEVRMVRGAAEEDLRKSTGWGWGKTKIKPEGGEIR